MARDYEAPRLTSGWEPLKIETWPWRLGWVLGRCMSIELGIIFAFLEIFN